MNKLRIFYEGVNWKTITLLSKKIIFAIFFSLDDAFN